MDCPFQDYLTLSQEFDQQVVDFVSSIMSYPMGSIFKEDQLAVVAVVVAGTRHTVTKCILLPNKEFKDRVHTFLREK